VDFVTCTRVQGEKQGRRMESDEHGGERMLNVAEEGEFGQTASLNRLNTGWKRCGWRGGIPVAFSVH
jgi:hypothetical protein